MKKESKNARTDRTGKIMHTILGIGRLHRMAVEEQISKLGIHCSQHHMLTIIKSTKGISQKEIAKKLEISSAAVAVTLNKLESAGLIVRNQSIDDARVNQIMITDKGNDLLKKTDVCIKALDNTIFDGISDEELDTIAELVEKMKVNLKGDDKEI